MKPKIAVDIDGVLAQFNKAFVALLEREEIASLPFDYEPTAWDYTPELTPAQLEAGFKALQESTVFWSQLDAYTENVQAVRRAVLRDRFDVYFVTARMDTKGESALAGTKMWLQQHSLMQMNTSIVVVKHASYKPSVYAALGVFASIDDHYPSVVAATTTENVWKGHQGTLLARPWNNEEGRAGVRVVETVEEWLEGL